MTKYSFILPAYKARFFEEALKSILDQTYTDFELIIVNDASPENLDSIVSRYDDPRITYYKNESNIGGSDLVGQWNKCLSYAKGEYVILASDDDVYSSQYLECMNALIDRYPEVNVFRPRIKRIDENGNILHIDGYISEFLSKVEYLYLWTSGLIGSGIPFFIFKREALLSIGGFANYPLAWFSDDATILRLADNGIVTCHKTLFSFRMANVSISTAQNTEQSLISKYEATRSFYDEHLGFIESHIPQTDEEAYLMPSIKTCFKLLIKDKVQSQLRISPLKVIISTSSKGLEIGCIKRSLIMYCYKYPIIAALKKLFQRG